MRLAAGVVAAALAVSACAGEGVSQAEYDQKVAELALAQQDLVEARNTIAELEGVVAGTDDVFDAVEAAVLDALGLTGIVADPGRDRIDALAEAVRATTEERDMLLEAIESGGGGEFGPTVDADRVDALARLAVTVQDWTRPGLRPASVTELESVRPEVDEIGDEMVTFAYEQLLEDYEAAGADEQVDLLMALAFWAVDMIRSSIVR